MPASSGLVHMQVYVCVCVCLGMPGVSQNDRDLLWFVARHNVRSQLVAEAKVREVLCTCHE